MRYIHKSKPPDFLTKFIREQAHLGVNLSYKDFPYKEELNDYLRTEQRLICCFCMQRIDHFQGENEGGSHNAHLLSQAGNPGRELDYFNIFASCNYSKGKTGTLRHCGEHQEDRTVHDFIRQTNCRDFFQYNVIGEILPRGAWLDEQAFKDNRQILTQSQLLALEAIEILNLNCEILKELRKRITSDIEKVLTSLTHQQAQAKIQRLNHQNPLTPFVELLIYHLNKV